METPTVEFPSNSERWDGNLQSVVFTAIFNGRHIACIVPREAFMDHVPWTPGDLQSLNDACLPGFRKYTDAIHHSARQLIEAGEINERSRIRITSFVP